MTLLYICQPIHAPCSPVPRPPNPEHPTIQIALNAAPNPFADLYLGTTFLDVVSRFRIIGHPVDRGHVKSDIESSVASPV